MLGISTMGLDEKVLALAKTYNLEIEYSAFTKPENHTEEMLSSFQQSELYPITTSIHGPFYDLMPCSEDPEVRRVAGKRILFGINACAALKISKIVFHTGWFPKTYSDERWLDNSLSFWTSVLDQCPKSFNLYIENVYEDSPDLLIKLVDSLNDKRVSVCLDLGHVNYNSTKSAEMWIQALGQRIQHVHIHNNYGDADSHNGLSGGSLDIIQTCKLLQKHSPKASWNMELRNEFEETIETLLKLQN